ncbi:MAG: urease accessory protein UreD [Marinovum algicola]|jgi:urease accessory protein|uniref:Urease accessory protein UreD n=1 Tax=Marinovum algicola TaxID=42444 RepID=A0A975WA65_9RHOB|nr:urease accessory protein UreD [Marinovum algicola]SEJ49662.1 urease accessory protein [Marinovum algicola]SLN33749.1 Urease accessory protein UreD [Marinovum algicola]
MLNPQQITSSKRSKPITLHPPIPQAFQPLDAQPRARGEIVLSAKRHGGRSVIDGLRQAGAMKALFPRAGAMLQTICINTAGGVTGGDRLSLTASAGPGAALGLTTQAAERAYRSRDGEFGRVDSTLQVAAGATLHWLPQELILYDGCALRRRLSVDLAADARLLMVEPVIFGRAAMGETLTDARFHDRITLRRAGQPLYCDAVRLEGDISRQLARRPIGDGAGAMASLVYVAPDAEAHLAAVRAQLATCGGASLLAPDVLVLRLLCPDSHVLRQHLLPVLDRLSGDTLPVSWRL